MSYKYYYVSYLLILNFLSLPLDPQDPPLHTLVHSSHWCFLEWFYHCKPFSTPSLVTFRPRVYRYLFQSRPRFRPGTPFVVPPVPLTSLDSFPTWHPLLQTQTENEIRVTLGPPPTFTSPRWVWKTVLRLTNHPVSRGWSSTPFFVPLGTPRRTSVGFLPNTVDSVYRRLPPTSVTSLRPT